MIFTVNWSHSLVESRSDNFKLFEKVYLSPSTCHSAIFTEKVQIIFIFIIFIIIFVPVDAQIHTWAHANDGIEEKKSKNRKIGNYCPNFLCLWNGGVITFLGKFYSPPVVIVSFSHKMFKSIKFFFSKFSYSHMGSHNWWKI